MVRSGDGNETFYGDGLRNCRHGAAMLMSVIVQNIVDMIIDYALWIAALRKEFSKIIEGN